MKDWFTVDKEGLAKGVVARKGKGFIVIEMWQNAVDEDVNLVEIDLTPIEGKRALYQLVVKDDSPTGFRDLSQAWTLYADSYKKSDTSKRGRFNLGEKLVLALCENALIRSTTGTVMFSDSGRLTNPDDRTNSGTVFEAEIRLTKPEFIEVAETVHQLLPPPGIKTLFNGIEIPQREPIHTFRVQLPTEIADDEGNLRRTRQMADVELYETGGATAMLYEMGIPVVETGDKWHVNVLKKVPLNTDRDNVTPSYLREVRTAVLNEMADKLAPEDTTMRWVNEALEDDNILPEAVTSVISTRFPKAVIYDPSDPEASKRAAAMGYDVIGGRTFNSDQWQNIRGAEALKPAGQVTPSLLDTRSFEGEDMSMQPEHYTPAIKAVCKFARELHDRFFGPNSLGGIEVLNHPRAPRDFAASYGAGIQNRLTLNLTSIGHRWFEAAVGGQRITSECIALLLHEYTHNRCSDHLSAEIHNEACNLGAQLSLMVAEDPELLNTGRYI